MKFRRLGFDLDNVIADTDAKIVEYVEETYDVDLKANERKSFKVEELPGVTEEMAEDIVSKVLDESFFYTVEPIEGAVDALKLFRRKSRTVHIITARPKDNFVFTSKWLKKHNIWYDNLICCPSAQKPRMAAELGIETFIDDRFDVLMNFVEFRQRGRFRKLGLMDKPWNRDYEHERIVRVRNWYEVMEFLTKR